MLETIVALTGLALVGALATAARAITRSIDRARLAPERSGNVHFEDHLASEIDKTNAKVEDLVLAVAEGIKRVDRAENRVQKTVTSARRLVREAGLEHAGIEAEYEELPVVDDEAQPLEQVLALPESVVDRAPSGIPGLTNEALDILMRR